MCVLFLAWSEAVDAWIKKNAQASNVFVPLACVVLEKQINVSEACPAPVLNNELERIV